MKLEFTTKNDHESFLIYKKKTEFQEKILAICFKYI